MLASPVQEIPDEPAKVVPVGWTQTGIASFYGRWHAGRKTSSGERFDPRAMTCAHRTLPMHSIVRVTDVDSGTSVVLVVNDRGPYRYHRVLDLSEGAARRLGFHDDGLARVRIERLDMDTDTEVAMAPEPADERPHARHARFVSHRSSRHHGGHHARRRRS